MVEPLTIFSNNIWSKVVLPFLLIFTLVFAVLEKSKVLGEGKRQVNALVALSIGLIVVLFGYAIYVINYMIAFLAVALVVIVVFMILTGLVHKEGEFKFSDNVKLALMWIIGIGVGIAAFYFTGAWGFFYEKLMGPSSSSSLVTNTIFVIVIVAVVAIVLYGGKEKSSEKKG
jgi:hypothetical protein